MDSEDMEGTVYDRGLLLMEWEGVFGTVCDDTH